MIYHPAVCTFSLLKCGKRNVLVPHSQVSGGEVMQITPLSGSWQYTKMKTESALQQSEDFQDILAQAQEEKDDAKLKQVCQEIEALFIQQLFKEMRATIPKDGILPESMATNIYQEMLDAEYSKLMAKSPGNLGIAEMLYQQLKR